MFPPFRRTWSYAGSMAARVSVTARIETGLAERFGLLAAQHDRTFSAELRRAMRRHLDEAPAGPDSPTGAPTTTANQAPSDVLQV